MRDVLLFLLSIVRIRFGTHARHRLENLMLRHLSLLKIPSAYKACNFLDLAVPEDAIGAALRRGPLCMTGGRVWVGAALV